MDNCYLTLGLVFEFDDLLLEGTCSSTLGHEGTSQNPLDDGALTGFGMDEKGLPVAAFNVQHYSNKIDAMQILLTQTPRPPDILFLLETFLDETFSDDELAIPGYMLFRKDRLCRCGGGILAYVRLEIPINQRTELETSELGILWLEIDYP